MLGHGENVRTSKFWQKLKEKKIDPGELLLAEKVHGKKTDHTILTLQIWQVHKKLKKKKVLKCTVPYLNAREIRWPVCRILYSHVCKKEENEKSTKKHLFCHFANWQIYFITENEKEGKKPVLLPEDLGQL
jgi:hypothetical protein